MRQKFKRFSSVRVCDDMPPQMAHFDSGFDAIVDGTYSQICGGNDIDSYALFKVEGGEVVNRISWYREMQLTAADVQDRDRAEEMVEVYNLGKV